MGKELKVDVNMVCTSWVLRGASCVCTHDCEASLKCRKVGTMCYEEVSKKCRSHNMTFFNAGEVLLV